MYYTGGIDFINKCSVQVYGQAAITRTIIILTPAFMMSTMKSIIIIATTLPQDSKDILSNMLSMEKKSVP